MPQRYPSKIVPHSRYRYRLPILNLLHDYPYLAVARRCKFDNPFVYSAKSKREMLREDALGDNLIEMSVNLLGGRFRIKHTPFVPKREDNKKDWDGKELPLLPLPRTEYEIESQWSVISFRVLEVNKFIFPYTKSIEKIEDYEQIKKEAQKLQEQGKLDIHKTVVGAFKQEENKMTSVYARLQVNHHPKPLNYWHMQMDVYSIGKDEYVKYDDKSGEARRIRHRMREYLTRKAICKIGKCYHIGKRYYMYGTGRCSYAFDGLLNWFVKRFFRFQYASLKS